ncbi:Protein indeterminate-domain 12 [Hibiscus syriacus]|uniref:Protein indeterminate-domain 12 n=1 Tax=Hibiscus syriacus TaxID=106335 RepID=A0A6A2XXK1_HIBSY|nr:protein indeterminate-domain 12-like [Hibiscus syriacus]XP_039041330.1 protein indeterminate-domain 12-like [Hibiscus syriacus]KAE8667006.1 Protein indeterminate-domain 12 [Hibiscus syriacus]
MFPTVMSNSSSWSEEVSVSSITRVQDNLGSLNPIVPTKVKKKRNFPGNPDPDAEVIALSPKSLLTTNRFVCEICNKGFQRDQNLQLHRRGHNLPWKLKQRSREMKKKAYVCPEPTCVHHHPSRALGDLTGIKKHFCRKHGEKRWKCEKCSKFYAVQSDWKAHSKTCGTREYRCDCRTLFSRKDSFITHRTFCDALAEESARFSANHPASSSVSGVAFAVNPPIFPFQTHISFQPWLEPTQTSNPNPNDNNNPLHVKPWPHNFVPFSQEPAQPPPPKLGIVSSFQNLHVSNNIYSNVAMPATALLQKAATVGATATQINDDEGGGNNNMASYVSSDFFGFGAGSLGSWQKSSDHFTRDFLGLTGDNHHHAGANGEVNFSMNVREVLTYAGGLELQQFERNHSMLKPQGFGFAEPASETWGDC